MWTSGIDNVIVDALKESGGTMVPVVGADNAGFVGQLLNDEGLVGAAVTNPGSVGGAGVTLALQILDGKKPAEQDCAGRSRAVGQLDRRGQGHDAKAAATRRSARNGRSAISIPDWTTYTKDQIVACKGPGE